MVLDPYGSIKTLCRSRSGAAVADISCRRLASGCAAAIGAVTLTSNYDSSHVRNGGRSVGDRSDAGGGGLGCLLPLAPRAQRLFERRSFMCGSKPYRTSSDPFPLQQLGESLGLVEWMPSRCLQDCSALGQNEAFFFLYIMLTDGKAGAIIVVN